MSGDPSPELKAEIGHVLLLDVVGYSKLLINQQGELLQTLKQIVQGTAAVQGATNLLRLATGDGMALVFRHDLEAPVECALQLAAALRQHPELHLRMGIHSGPIREVLDVNERANVTGAGIDVAQRVMDCGDAGHILLSKRAADDLAPYPRWHPLLHDLGEAEVKHGARVHLFNLYSNEAGNPETPAKLATLSKTRSAEIKQSSRPRLLLAIGTGMLLAVLAASGWFLWHRSNKAAASGNTLSTATAIIPKKSIAVLPFENLSSDKENAYFADGVQEEILTKLASIADLKVISRSSTAKYKSKPGDLKTVAQQLGVATVLEGTVQKADGKVRVNVQLIDARTDAHLWAKSYDRELKDVFAVESEISQQVADALRAKLSLSEANVLATAPTRDPEAYDLFLRGEYEFREGQRLRRAEPFDRAAAYYQQALDRDPQFALAAARLAYSRLATHWYISPKTQAELNEVKPIVDRALALAPDLAESHVALGVFYYWGQRQYEAALKEFRRALELQPNNVNALRYSGFVHRRQGQWRQCLSDLAKAEELDPRDAETSGNIGETYVNLRQWPEARRAGSRALALTPNDNLGMRVLVAVSVNGEGDIEGAKRALAGFPEGVRLTVNALRGNVASIIDQRTYLHVLERDFAGALKDWEEGSSDPAERITQLSARVAIRVLAGEAVAASAESEEARALLEERLRERPDEAFAMAQLSWVYLALARDSDALRLAQQAADSLPIARDALVGPFFALGLAQIQAHTGHSHEAVKTLRYLLSIPAGWEASLPRLRIDPVWDPIRNDLEFQQILESKEQIGPNE
ncbi:MAG: hypothetical protein ABIU29_05370 [Chthoniobacterales bacterium]